MRGVGIITDASAQFLTPHFPGRDRVHILPLPIAWEGQHYPASDNNLSLALPPSLVHRSPPAITFPDQKALTQQLQALARQYDGLLIVPMGNSLTTLFQHLAEAATAINNSYPVYMVDSQTTGVALGWLVQTAAAEAHQYADIFTILRRLRGMVSRIYTALCAQSLTYLDHSGFLEPSQAIVGEMLDLHPFFVLEEGRLAPLQKARSSRHLLDLMQEFTTEFAHLQAIAITHHPRYFRREAHNLRERLIHAGAPSPIRITEMNTLNTVLFGPRTLTLYVRTM